MQKMYEQELGAIIDCDQEVFEKSLVEQNMNVGDMNNLILVLENTYNLLRSQKDGVIDLVTSGQRTKDDPEVKKCLEGLYAEMTKIEMKVTHLKTRVKDLSKQWKTPVDTDV